MAVFCLFLIKLEPPHPFDFFLLYKSHPSKDTRDLKQNMKPISATLMYGRFLISIHKITKENKLTERELKQKVTEARQKVYIFISCYSCLWKDVKL